jgi:BarA-like signal transduction histidine kinase
MGVSQSFSQPFYKVILTQLAREWERNRAISEDTLKKNIYMLHYLAKKFTPVDIIF